MGRSLKFLFGATATGLIAVGVAAQTGTIPWPYAEIGSGGVKVEQVSTSPTNEMSPSPSPTPAQH